jgi:hypothetical protein
MTRTLTPMAIACLLACAGALPAAHAADAPAAKGERKKVDRDGDGRVSRDEARGFARLEKSFDRIDTNKDGFLSQEELAAARKKAAEQKKGAAPAN